MPVSIEEHPALKNLLGKKYKFFLGCTGRNLLRFLGVLFVVNKSLNSLGNYLFVF